MAWKVEVRPVGPLQMNSILVTGEGPEGAETLLIDPGAEADNLLEWIRQSGGKLVGRLATHGHFDHVGAAAEVQEVHDIPLRCHADDLELIRRMPQIQEAYGFEPGQIPVCAADLKDGDTISFAGSEILVQHVPGHCPGQLMFVLAVAILWYTFRLLRPHLRGRHENLFDGLERAATYAIGTAAVFWCLQRAWMA